MINDDNGIIFGHDEHHEEMMQRVGLQLKYSTGKKTTETNVYSQGRIAIEVVEIQMDFFKEIVMNDLERETGLS